jgi:AcrR family transcriptional regulator
VRKTGRAVSKAAPAPKKPTPSRRRSGEEIRQLLLDAARTEFKAKGFDGATTAAIAKRARVAEIQLYRQFSSKMDLFSEAIFAPVRDHFRDFNAKHTQLARDPAIIRQKANRYVLELLDLLNDHATLLVSLLSPAKAHDAFLPNGANSIGDGLQNFLDESAAAMAARAVEASDVDARMIGRIAFAAVLGCVTYRAWLFPDAAENAPAIDRAMANFILTGIAPYSDVGISTADT